MIMEPWNSVSTLVIFSVIFAVNSAEEKTKEEGLALVQTLVSLSGNNTSATVIDKVKTRVGTPLDAQADTPSIGNNGVGTLDLNDPAQRKQFLEQLSSPGTSGSFATSNSYQQFGKAINYAISVSYAPILATANNRNEDPKDDETPKDVEKPKQMPRLSKPLGSWAPSPVVTDGHGYFTPYVYYYRYPPSYYPTLH